MNALNLCVCMCVCVCLCVCVSSIIPLGILQVENGFRAHKKFNPKLQGNSLGVTVK
jgi:predicted component of type VI protein secretion system